MLTNLSLDMKCEILCWVPLNGLKNMRLLNKHWCQVLNNDKFWQRRLTRDYPNFREGRPEYMTAKVLYFRVMKSGNLFLTHQGKQKLIETYVLNIYNMTGTAYWIDIFGRVYCYDVNTSTRKLLLEPEVTVKSYQPWHKKLCVTWDNQFYDLTHNHKYADNVKMFDFESPYYYSCSRLAYLTYAGELYSTYKPATSDLSEHDNNFYLIAKNIVDFKFIRCPNDLKIQFICIRNDSSLIRLTVEFIWQNLDDLSYTPQVVEDKLIGTGVIQICDLVEHMSTLRTQRGSLWQYHVMSNIKETDPISTTTIQERNISGERLVLK